MRHEPKSVGRNLEWLFRLGTVGGMTDRQLLDQFVSGDDEAATLAFEAIVERHGPMILRVCRMVLRDSHAAEDAFQAVFLVLARKAQTLSSGELLGNWLHGVAFRSARKAKVMAARRQIRERQAASWRPIAAVEPLRDRMEDDLEQVLHEEIERLPRPYRAAVVACYLEGLSQAQAARQFRVTESTLRGRLARARKLLGQRLTRRGISPSMGLVALNASTHFTERLPAVIVRVTCDAALRFMKQGKAMPEAVSATAQCIAQGVLLTMRLNSLRTVAATLMATGLVAAGASLAALRPAEAQLQVGPSHTEKTVEITAAPSAPAQDESTKPASGQRRRKGQKSSESVTVDQELVKRAPGPIVRTVSVSQDCTIIAYLPNQNLGHVERVVIQNGGGGVRALLDWPPVSADEANRTDRQFLLALYSRKTQSNPPTGPVLAFELLEGWREMTWWTTQPKYNPEPAATYSFEPRDGWKLFDVTPLIRAQAKAGRSSHGILLRFLSEDAAGNALSGYDFVSREGTGQEANVRPLLLVVKASNPAKTDPE
jgi:RNA polymerase sigma factor (sigma-70 family)